MARQIGDNKNINFDDDDDDDQRRGVIWRKNRGAGSSELLISFQKQKQQQQHQNTGKINNKLNDINLSNRRATTMTGSSPSPSSVVSDVTTLLHTNQEKNDHRDIFRCRKSSFTTNCNNNNHISNRRQIELDSSKNDDEEKFVFVVFDDDKLKKNKTEICNNRSEGFEKQLNELNDNEILLLVDHHRSNSINETRKQQKSTRPDNIVNNKSICKLQRPPPPPPPPRRHVAVTNSNHINRHVLNREENLHQKVVFEMSFQPEVDENKSEDQRVLTRHIARKFDNMTKLIEDVNESLRVLDDFNSCSASSKRTCPLDSSNGSNSIISNISYSTSSSNNSSIVLAAAAATTTSNGMVRFNLNDFEDEFESSTSDIRHQRRVYDEENDEFIENAYLKSSSSPCFSVSRAFDNLTYLSSLEDVSVESVEIIKHKNDDKNEEEKFDRPSVPPLLLTGDDCDDDDNEADLIGSNLAGDLLVKKTLKSIKRKDKLKKEARSSSLASSMNNLTSMSSFELDGQSTETKTTVSSSLCAHLSFFFFF